MDEAAAGKIKAAFCEVLNRQVFLFADPVPDGEFEAGEGTFQAATIRFRGEVEGRITMALPDSMMREIAANFLGMDADDPFVAAKSGDACKELLNVACGHILTALKGDGPIFDLSIPELASVDAHKVADWAAGPDALPFDVDGSPVLLRVHWGSSDPEKP